MWPAASPTWRGCWTSWNRYDRLTAAPSRGKQPGRNFMIDFVTDNWGSLASAAGLVVACAGIGWAIIESRRARSAAQAACAAANETRNDIVRYLQAVDLERAIALIQRIKLLHNSDQWQTAIEHYQPLRAMLADIIARCPDGQSELRGSLDASIRHVRQTENFVAERISQGISERDKSRLNRRLNSTQSNLEELASAMGFGDSQGGP